MERRHVRVLLIEDSEPDILLMRMAFRGVGTRFALSVVMDGNEAVDFLFRQGRHEDADRPDLIILDVNLPGRSGHDVLQLLRGSAELKRLPVVIFSSSGASRDVQRSYELFANCYVQKPTDVDDFYAAVQGIETFWLDHAVLA